MASLGGSSTWRCASSAGPQPVIVSDGAISMDKIVVEGGRRLEGLVSISGAKNAALPILAAALLTDGTCRFTNVPDLRDIHSIVQLLQSLGPVSSSRTIRWSSMRLDWPAVKPPTIWCEKCGRRSSFSGRCSRVSSMPGYRYRVGVPLGRVPSTCTSKGSH